MNIADGSFAVPAETLMALARFALGYLLIMAVPGPNMLAIGTVAAMHGWRCALPACAGLATGAAALALLLHMALGTALPALEDPNALRLAAGIALLMAAALLLRPPRADRPARATAGARLWFLTCFATAATNPVTAGYFAAQLLGPLAEADAAAAMLAWVPVQAFAWFALVAGLFARSHLRAVAMRHRRGVRVAAAATLTSLGVIELA